MAKYIKKDFNQWQEDQKGKADKAYDLFAEMLIDKLENCQKTEWKQPWFTEGVTAWPRALYGKKYKGMNALMLFLHSEQEGYRIPIFATSKYINDMNYKWVDGKRTARVDKEGNKLPFIHVLEGSHGFPVFHTNVSVKNRETKQPIKWSEYVRLDDDERKNYNVYRGIPQVYRVFNVDQTNMKEARPELYAKLEAECVDKKIAYDGPNFTFEPLDVMVEKGEWICPITPKLQNDAYYSPSKNEIVVPVKQQFLDKGNPEAYYGTMLHEMAHSTGAEAYCNRFQPSYYDNKDAYAKEELVAELVSATECHRYGIDKVISEDSIPYVQHWLSTLKEKPDFVRTLMSDIRKASSVIDSKIEFVCERYLSDDVSKEVKDDLREEEEDQLEFDEDGDLTVSSAESLEPDKKQGEGEKPEAVQQEHRSGGIHR